MHLKTLSLVGFKSFADRTRIECEPGVTVVVGPNGSGKSNLVDAMAWVMGTQATSSLRTEKMEDVIFAGTAVRPALGRAEVALTFENDGSLDLDLAEVTIARRLFRDGTSEYEINGTSCRLMDIQELLGDSGVGRHQHVIVGQGRVDAVLNAGPEEHRAVIEEAAGVIKHRVRRDRAIRRLETTDVDIERLAEILEEQNRRLRPLKRQANAAAKHDQVKAEWRAVRLWVGAEQLREARGRLAEIESAVSDLEAQIDAEAAERRELTGSLPALQEDAGAVGGALERDTAAAARLETTAERLHSISVVARERRSHVERDREGVGARRSDLENEVTDLNRQLEQTAVEESAAADVARRAETSLRALEDEERSLSEADHLSAEGVMAALRGDLAALEASEQRDARESADIARRRGTVAAIIEEEVAEGERLREELATAVAALEEARTAEAAVIAAADGDRATAEEADDAHRAAEASLAAAHARLEVLEHQVDPPAPSPDSPIDGVAGVVMPMLDVPEGLVAAVRAALGVWAGGLVAGDGEEVADLAERLRSAGLPGVVAFADGGGEHSDSENRLADGLGPAADRDLAAALLGDVVVAADLGEAVAVVAADRSVRAVTLEGDLVTRRGVVAAASEAHQIAITDARRAIEKAERSAARARSRRTTTGRAAANAATAVDAAMREVAARSGDAGGLEQAIALLEQTRAERTFELERLETRTRGLAESAAARAERITSLRARLSGLEGEEAERQAAWDELAERRQRVGDERATAQRAREEAAGALAAASERRELLRSRIAAVEAELAGIEAPTDVDTAPLLLVEETAAAALSIVRRHITALRDRQRELRSQMGDAGARLEEAQARREELSASLEKSREQVSALTVEAAELRVREEAALEGLRRDVDAEAEVALAAEQPEIPEGVDPGEHADALAARLRRLGPVNPLAAAEYEELSQRVDFMQGQLDDLHESRSELRKVIRALDEEIARQFQIAYEDIAAKFSENFRLLFPGGTGELTLTELDSPLTTGVDIHAQPMGKKVGRLQLLSGGERSLAALAFLFAVFRSRPSPFYVLDEVEAALDDANLRRFLRLVDTLRDTSQLVIVTHQQQTMEAADLLYGVTMEPGESSQLLAKRLTPA